MSPASRGRKAKKNRKSTRRRAQPDMFGALDACDCPACSGAEVDPQQLIDALTASAADLLVSADPLDAEVMGATLMSIGALVGEDSEAALTGRVMPALEEQATSEALALLLAVGSVAEGQVGKAALTTAERLVMAGVPQPGWATELSEPVTVTDCSRLSDNLGAASILACAFHRAGRSHAVVMTVDHLECGAASEIYLFGADQLSATLRTMVSNGREQGLTVTQEALDPAEFRWQLENAMDARAVHDSDEPELGMGRMPLNDDDPPTYHTMAVLLRARLDALPISTKHKAPHGDGEVHRAGLTALETLRPVPPRRRTTAAKLPAKRKKSDGVAPVYQIKVELRGAKPPIWRRLDVPADISLARLHTVIQVAFAWDDSHLHVFQTPYGEFGISDPELGHQAEAPVTLEQAAPAVRNKISYTYDFGDCWEHDIVVEKVLSRDETVSYPCCRGGRGAAPPEDCGGIWGYAHLVEVLADPNHPEHEDRLEWLGLDDANQFDPAGFDASAVTQSLSRMS